jgi:hypothetical protein
MELFKLEPLPGNIKYEIDFSDKIFFEALD